jgi:SH3-like domain-containing protein
MDRRACLDDANLANWLESTVDGARLRRGPGQDHAAIGWLRRGAMAEHLGEDGEWIEVLTWTGQQGWVHGSLLAPYLTLE